MNIATAQSRTSDLVSAVNDLAGSLAIDARGMPDFVALHFGVGTAAAGLHAAAAARFGTAALHGGSSCLGIMTQDGVNIASGAGLGAFAIWDAAGSYGTGSCDLGTDAGDAAQRATQAALANAGRPGEIPDLVWLTVAPRARGTGP